MFTAVNPSFGNPVHPILWRIGIKIYYLLKFGIMQGEEFTGTTFFLYSYLKKSTVD